MQTMQKLETKKKQNRVFAAALTNDKRLSALLREGNQNDVTWFFLNI